MVNAVAVLVSLASFRHGKAEGFRRRLQRRGASKGAGNGVRRRRQPLTPKPFSVASNVSLNRSEDPIVIPDCLRSGCGSQPCSQLPEESLSQIEASLSSHG